MLLALLKWMLKAIHIATDRVGVRLKRFPMGTGGKNFLR